MLSLFFQTFLEMGQRASEIFGGLDLPYNPFQLVRLIPVLVLNCAVLISSNKNKDFCHRICYPTSAWPPSPTIARYYQQSPVTADNPCLLLPVILGWLRNHSAISVSESSGILQRPLDNAA